MTVGSPVRFDGAADTLTRGGALTNIVDGKIGLAAGWFRDLGAAGSERRIFTITNAGASRVVISRNSANNFLALARDSGGTNALQVLGPTISDTNWHHFALSFNMANAAERSLMYDGVDASPTWDDYADLTIDFLTATPETVVGGLSTSTLLWNGDLAEFFFHTPASYYDLTVGSNLAKFISNGAPVDLGSDGSNVLGSQPIVCLNKDTANWRTNAGSGGGFTENGALADGEPLPTGARKFILTRPA